MKSGAVVDLVDAEEAIRHAVDLAERAANVQVDPVLVSMSAGRITSELIAASDFDDQRHDGNRAAISHASLARGAASSVKREGRVPAAYGADRVLDR